MFVTPLTVLRALLCTLSTLFTPTQLSSHGYLCDACGGKKSFPTQYALTQDKRSPEPPPAWELLHPSGTSAISIFLLIVPIPYLHSVPHESAGGTFALREENVDVFPACKLILNSNTLLPPPCSLSPLNIPNTHCFHLDS